MAEQVPEREIRILKLANSFPCLRGAPGVGSGLWDALKLDAWAAGGASSGEKHSSRFVLGVWNSGSEWDCGKFDIFHAIDIWDCEHREAFLKWAIDPWFA